MRMGRISMSCECSPCLLAHYSGFIGVLREDGRKRSTGRCPHHPQKSGWRDNPSLAMSAPIAQRPARAEASSRPLHKVHFSDTVHPGTVLRSSSRLRSRDASGDSFTSASESGRSHCVTPRRSLNHPASSPAPEAGPQDSCKGMHATRASLLERIAASGANLLSRSPMLPDAMHRNK